MRGWPRSGWCRTGASSGCSMRTSRVSYESDLRLGRRARGPRLRFFHPLCAQDVGHAIVAFVARVLVHREGRPLERVLTGPRGVPGVGIFDRELIADGVGVGVGEPLGHLQVLGRAAERGAIGEVGRLDDQGVAVPARARVAKEGADRRADVRPAIERRDARHRHHLGNNHELAGRLHELKVVVVAGRQQRRAVVRPVDAALGDAAGLRRIVLSDAAPRRLAILRALAAFFVDGRNPAVGRRDDRRPQRGHALRSLLRHPDRIVVVGVGIRLIQESFERPLSVRRSLGLGKELPVLQFGRTFERRVRLGCPRALEIGSAISCPRNRRRRLAGGPLRCRGGLGVDGQPGRGDERDDEGCKTALNHDRSLTRLVKSPGRQSSGARKCKPIGAPGGMPTAHPFPVPGPPDPLALRQWSGTLNGPVILPGDAAFDSARVVWNRAIDVRPAAIARCADPDDVARTIEFARAQAVPLAVRSGGHSQGGHGTCDGGIVLDLGGFRGVGVHRDERIARVASGSRVVDVMDATQAYGLLTPMGGCPDVGVGGLTLGGGENFLMAKYGAVCDNVLSADVVLADGRRVTANEREHADLFWALRGGSGNFGVVTAFEYRLHEVTDVLSGQLMFDVRGAREAMLRYRELVAEAPDELTTSGGLSPIQERPTFFVSVCFCGDRREGDRLVGQWIDHLRPRHHNVKWAPYASELSVPAAPSVGTGRFLPELSDRVLKILASSMRGAPTRASAVWNEFHGAVTRVPLDAMAFPLRHRGFDLFISIPCETDAECTVAIAWSSALAEELRPFSRGVYVNNLNETESNRVRDAYGPHYDRLAAIKATYDPDNFLRVNHNIPPK